MSNWLSKFITEDLYIIRESNQVQSQTLPSAPKVSEGEPAPQVNKNEVHEELSNSIDNLSDLAIIIERADLEANRDLLDAIVGSIDATTEDAQIFFSKNELSGRFRLTLHFDSDASQKYQAQGDDETIIHSDSLASLEQDRTLKLQLWNSLKLFKASQKSQ